MTAIDRDQVTTPHDLVSRKEALAALEAAWESARSKGRLWGMNELHYAKDIIAALPAIPLDDEFIRNLLDVAPCVGAETGFCHAHDQRVKDCEEYFEYQKNRVQNLFKNSGLSLPLLETKKETT